VAHYAQRLGVADLGAVQLAVSEAATNAVVHAYREGEPGELTVEARRVDRSLEVTVADDGVGMRPRPDSPGLGLGLPLIAQLAETFEVTSPAAGGVRLCMRFPLAA
jgi:serine/threonine-protein kinase RsbW/stage II sporulation protein AB (anti-sigma F factor)